MLRRILTTFCLFIFASFSYAFESELFPTEGKPSFAAATDILKLHKEPVESSPVIYEYKIKKGEEIHYDLTRYRNINPGIIEVLQPFKFEGLSYGNITYLSEKSSSISPWKVYTFKKGDIIEELQSLGEGQGIIRWKNEIIIADNLWWYVRTKEFYIKSKPTNEWWIRVIKNKKPIGWLQIKENLVKRID